MRSVLVLPDIHYPYEDKLTMVAVERYMKSRKWDNVIYLGDVLDFDCISSHNKNNLRAVAGKSLSLDYLYVNKVFDRHQKLVDGAKIIYLEGNHEFRLERYIDANPTMKGSLEVAHRLNLKQRGIEWIRSWSKGDIYRIGKAAFIHGRYVNDIHSKSHVMAYGENIFYGHCFTADTEILTRSGWKLGINLYGYEEVATLNTKTNKLEFQNFSNKVIYSKEQYPTVLNIKGQNVDLAVTAGHGMVTVDKRGSFDLCTALDLTQKSTFTLPLARPQTDSAGCGLSEQQLKLVIWIAADGHFENQEYKTTAVRWHLKKERKIERLCKLLSELEIEYTKSNKSKTGSIKIYAGKLPTWVDLWFDKTKKKLPDLLGYCNVSQIETILTEIIHTDGCKNGDTIQFSTAKECEADLVQELSIRAGHRANKTKTKSGWIVSINTARNNSELRRSNIFEITNNDNVWCVSVPNGTLVVRRNGNVTITQNTHDLQSYSQTKMGDNKTIIGQSLGCLCDYKPYWMKGRPNRWQQAIATFSFFPDGFFTYNVIPIFRHRFAAEGEIFDGCKS